MKKVLEYSVVLAVVTIILLILIPLPVTLIDILIVCNISISLMILIITMTIKEPLEFSVFPSLLLITTIFRLGLNVSTTRNILGKMGESGKIIKAFGDFVLQGNVVVGLVIFIIIVLMQFIVITKGAERVAEVAARFNLDAMPGKQMAIDADLSSGLIDEQQAKIRRSKIQREADFYGAMDGATKIVKGDSVMSLIITAINLIGGSIIGMVASNLPVKQVLSTYALATVGDGLVSQIPALLISTATGMIVTRAVSEGSLNEDVSGQFKAQPHAIIIAGVVVVVMSFVPGMPRIQMLVVAVILMSSGVYLARQIEAIPKETEDETLPLAEANKEQGAEEEEEPVSEEEYFKDVNNIYSLLNVEPIELDFGYSLISLADESLGGRLISRIIIFRRQYAQDMGYVVPAIRLRDNAMLSTNEYVIKIKGEEIAKGEILVDYYLALEPENVKKKVDGIKTIEPAYGIPSLWIRPEERERAEVYGYTVIEPISVMVSHMSEVIRQHSFEILNRQEVVRLVENMAKTSPYLVEEAFPQVISYSCLQNVLVALLKENVPIKDLETIVETMYEFIQEKGLPLQDFDGMVERVRLKLRRTITHAYSEDGTMKVVTLDADLEKTLVESLTQNNGEYYLALTPKVMQSIILQIGEQVKKFNSLSKVPVILTSQIMRIHLYRLIEKFYPKVRVIAFDEVSNNVQIQAVGNLSLETVDSK